MAKGVTAHTAARGEQHGKARLTWEIVRQIRAEHVLRSPTAGTRALAERYGVSVPCVLSVLTGRTWVEPGMQQYTPERRVPRRKGPKRMNKRKAALIRLVHVWGDPQYGVKGLAKALGLKTVDVARVLREDV